MIPKSFQNQLPVEMSTSVRTQPILNSATLCRVIGFKTPQGRVAHFGGKIFNILGGNHLSGLYAKNLKYTLVLGVYLKYTSE